MANEFTIPAFKASLANGNLKETMADEAAINDDQATKGISEHVQSIPTTAAGTALTMTNITTAGWSFFKNTEASGGNFVEVGVQVAATFHPFLKVKAGKWQWIYLSTNAPYARADTGAVKLHHKIAEA